MAGYLCGGRSQGLGLTAVIDKLTFPSDTQSVSSATLSAAREFLGASGMADYGVAGYISGGDTSGGTVTTIDKVEFPVTSGRCEFKNASLVRIEYDNDGTKFSNGKKFARRVSIFACE